MFHTSLLKIINIEPNTPDKNVCNLQRNSLTKVKSDIWLIDTYLPRLILCLDKFMPSTSASQKSVGSLCLKEPDSAGFDYPVVRWWMYAW